MLKDAGGSSRQACEQHKQLIMTKKAWYIGTRILKDAGSSRQAYEQHKQALKRPGNALQLQ